MRDKDLEDISDALRSFDSTRILITFDRVQGGRHVEKSDHQRHTDLKAMADAGHGRYVTDGTTFEALVGYDIAKDARVIVIYRLPQD